ncbi:MAG: arginase family protein [Verrucomicrobia bacterium]|nr:arginase family protein [Verrucomicrobiota bacterium]
MHDSSAQLAQHIDLDGAWPKSPLGTDCFLDCRAWGPQLRYCAPGRIIEAFYREVGEKLTPFTLFGSGDFHHLTALWVRQFDEPFVLISFDNHPDWDTRPPRWCCGTWISRALESADLKKAVIWGCANFELNPPHRWFANHAGLRAGRLEVWPWIERFGPSARARWSGIAAGNWKDQFAAFANHLSDSPLYITIDMDCLRPETASTDWEQGLFTPEDIAWALGKLRESTTIIGGDLCGAHSPAQYSRWTQRQTALIDHPKKAAPDSESAARLNLAAAMKIWPALIGAR